MSLRVRGCDDCLRKAIEIDRLHEQVARLRKENDRLRKQLGKQHRRVLEAPFGSSTPSSRQLVKAGGTAENRAKKGGGKPGHTGHGRRPLAPQAWIDLPPLPCCPDCGQPLDTLHERTREVLDAQPLRPIVHGYRYAHQHCRHCGRFVDPVVPGVLPKAKLSNRLLAVIAGEHYLHGMPMGQVAKRLDLSEGTAFNAMHTLAQRLAKVPALLLGPFRQAPCKHADETTWRIDGANGYSWFFGNETVSIFRFDTTRAGSVVTEVLGAEPLPGALVVDRYPGYNVSPCARQFCYAHLLRDVLDLQKQFPDDTEVAAFVQALAPLLAEAMHLHCRPLADDAYYAAARALKGQILAVVNHTARHCAIQNLQSIFREQHQRLYLWVDDRCVPADNNFAERALRPTVIARKVSFGSQSTQGAHTRAIIMTAMHTLAKRVTHPVETLRQALDALVLNPALDLARLLFPTHANDG